VAPRKGKWLGSVLKLANILVSLREFSLPWLTTVKGAYQCLTYVFEDFSFIRCTCGCGPPDEEMTFQECFDQSVRT
jgi:hypothetical protein